MDEETAKIYRAQVNPEDGRPISIEAVQSLAYDGIPGSTGLRTVYWQLLLRYLPRDKSLWASWKAEQKKRYLDLKGFFKFDPHKFSGDSASVPVDDHPLSTSSGSKWKEWFSDKEVIGRIDRDLYRTFPETGFFSVDDVLTRDGQALEDILFVYSKVNKGMGYVQGMNEVIAPIYLVFHDDPNFEDLEQLETDVFFCFSNLMGEINECFIQKNGNATLDTTWMIGRFQALLALLDKELFWHLHKLNVDPRFYGVRWLSLLFAQEFQLSDLLYLWDTLFGDPHRFEFLLFFACAMVIDLKPTLMKSDFGMALITLQNYPEINVPDMIRKAKQLRVRVPRSALSENALNRVIDPLIKEETAVSDSMQSAQEEINNAAIAFVLKTFFFFFFFFCMTLYLFIFIIEI